MPLVFNAQRLFLCQTIRPYSGFPVQWTIFSVQHFASQRFDFLGFRFQLMCSIVAQRIYEKQ